MVSYETYRPVLADGTQVEVRLGDLYREVIRADRPRSEQHLELGIRVLWRRLATDDFECVCEYWANTSFEATAEHLIAAHLKGCEQRPPNDLPDTVDEFLEELEEFFAQGCGVPAPGYPRELNRPQPSTLATEAVEVSVSDDGYILLAGCESENKSIIKVHPSLTEELFQRIQQAKKAIDERNLGR